MDSINGFEDLGSLGIATRRESQPTTAKDELGQEQFLELMIAQFRNQDPMEPMSNGEFLSQLAQFGTVSGIGDLQNSFSALSESIYSDQALQAAGLVGHQVLARTDQGYLADGGTLNGAVNLSAGASGVTVEITDQTGQLVRRLELGGRGSGLTQWRWDGMNTEGEAAAPGNYRVSTIVSRGNQVENAQTLVGATIESVTLGRNGQGLTLNIAGEGSLRLSEVDRIL
ncbi:flagellar hook assembly protein FlgD [Lentisalinibacter sediminis]|uniref:flagellar hook assembly protein FlgD n=1 Tax=Lentisalinibacter sediminis TaxID=2992237 RepID=UPI00386BF71B